MMRSRSSFHIHININIHIHIHTHIHIHYSQVKLGRTKYVGKVMKKTNEYLMPWNAVRGG